MSYGLAVLVSGIPPNKEVGLPADRYFKCGDEQDLQDKLKHHLQNKITKSEQHNLQQHNLQQQIAGKYNWLKIAQQTIEVYENVLRKSKKSPLPISAQSTFG